MQTHLLISLKIIWITDKGEPLYHSSCADAWFEVPEANWSAISIIGFKYSSLELQNCPGTEKLNDGRSTIVLNVPFETKTINIMNSPASCLELISNSTDQLKLNSINLSQANSMSIIKIRGCNASSLCNRIEKKKASSSRNRIEEKKIIIQSQGEILVFSNSHFRTNNDIHEIDIPLDSLTIVLPPPGYDTNKNEAKTFSNIKLEGKIAWSTQFRNRSIGVIKKLTILVTPGNDVSKEFQDIQDIFKDHLLDNLKIIWVANDGELCDTQTYEGGQLKPRQINWPDINNISFKYSSLELQSCPGTRKLNTGGSVIGIDLPFEVKQIDIADPSATCLELVSNSVAELKLKLINLYQKEPMSTIRLKGTKADSLFRKIKNGRIKVRTHGKIIQFLDSHFRKIDDGHEITVPSDSPIS